MRALMVGVGPPSGRAHLRDPRAWRGPGGPKPSEFAEKWHGMNGLQRVAFAAGVGALMVGGPGLVLPVVLVGVLVALACLYFPRNGRFRAFAPPALVILTVPAALALELANGYLPAGRGLVVLTLAFVHGAAALAGGRLAGERAAAAA